jgi:DNA modification methylase
MSALSVRPSKVIAQVLTDEAALFHADCVEVARGLPDSSVHLLVTSTPFGSLYSYSDSTRDFSNVRDNAEFFKSMEFLGEQVQRIMIPGRLIVFHCMQLPCTIEHDGYIGLYDFRGDLIRFWQRMGFIYHSEVVIWKDPLVAATRTHALGLAHQQIVKDSAMCRQGIPDYLVVMRKPGKNPEPVAHPNGFERWVGSEEDGLRLALSGQRTDNHRTNKYSHHVWQRYASPVWFDINPSDTLQKDSVRDEDDSRHIAPLQLTVIRRSIELWSNPGDIVFDPFGGIGSVPVVALQEGRRAVASELKDTYYRQMTRNVEMAVKGRSQMRIGEEA